MKKKESLKKDNKDFFRESTVRICGSLDIERALRHFLSYACDVIPLNQITLNL